MKEPDERWLYSINVIEGVEELKLSFLLEELSHTSSSIAGAKQEM